MQNDSKQMSKGNDIQNLSLVIAFSQTEVSNGNEKKEKQKCVSSKTKTNAKKNLTQKPLSPTESF